MGRSSCHAGSRVTPPAPLPAAASGTAPRRGRRARTSSSCVPRSTMRPFSSTRIWSASRTVEIRCETMIDVRSRMTPRSRRQDLLLGVRVHRRQRIVQDQDRRVDHQRARERRALLLPARQRDAALADHRVVALGELRHVLVEPARCPAARPRRGPSAQRPADAVPKAMLSASVSEKRNGSCGTKPMAAAARRATGRARPRRRGTPCPAAGRSSRGSRLMSVDLPDPVAPDERHRLPRLDRGPTRRRRTVRSPNANVRSRNSISPRDLAAASHAAGPPAGRRSPARRRAPRACRFHDAMPRAAACW